MSDLVLVLRQVRFEQRSFWRNPASAFFAFAFPIMFLVIFGTLNQGSRINCLGHIPFNAYYVPALITFGVIGACTTNIAMSVSIRRDSGVLMRLRGTPLPPWAFMAGLIGSSAVVGAILAALIAAVGVLLYGVGVPRHPATLLLVLLVGGACFCALGLALAALLRVLYARALSGTCAECNPICRSFAFGFGALRSFTCAAQVDDVCAHVFFRKESIETIFSLLPPVGLSSVLTALGRGRISAGSEPLPRGFALSGSLPRFSASFGLGSEGRLAAGAFGSGFLASLASASAASSIPSNFSPNCTDGS